MKTEGKIQQECLVWFRNNYSLKHHTPRLIMASVPNEGKNAIEQMRKKQMGMLSGVADTFVMFPNGKLVWIEFKDDKGKQSENQKAFEQDVKALGFSYHIVRSLDQFRIIINNEIMQFI